MLCTAFFYAAVFNKKTESRFKSGGRTRRFLNKPLLQPRTAHGATAKLTQNHSHTLKVHSKRLHFLLHLNRSNSTSTGFKTLKK
jgi:hypothetical protein